MTISYGNLTELIASVKTESDRATALIYAANLDNRLKELLTAYFVDVGKDFTKSVYEGNGPLGTFSSKISLAYMSGLLSGPENHDLSLIRKIRNHFAHEEHGWDFSRQEIQGRCKSFKLIQDLHRKRPDLAYLTTAPRDAFVVCAGALTIGLYQRVNDAASDKRKEPPTIWVLDR